MMSNGPTLHEQVPQSGDPLRRRGENEKGEDWRRQGRVSSPFVDVN